MNKISTPCITCNVKACSLINSLDKNLLPIISQYKLQFQFKKGEVIFTQGEPVSGVYFIQSGVVKQELTGIKGKPLILRLCGQGKMMGHRSISSKARHPYTATAVEDCRICFMDLEFFRNLLRRSEALQKEVLNPKHMVHLGRDLFSTNLVAIELAANLLMVSLVGAIAMVAHDKHSHDVEAANAAPRLASGDREGAAAHPRSPRSARSEKPRHSTASRRRPGSPGQAPSPREGCSSDL